MSNNKNENIKSVCGTLIKKDYWAKANVSAKALQNMYSESLNSELVCFYISAQSAGYANFIDFESMVRALDKDPNSRKSYLSRKRFP